MRDARSSVFTAVAFLGALMPASAGAQQLTAGNASTPNFNGVQPANQPNFDPNVQSSPAPAGGDDAGAATQSDDNVAPIQGGEDTADAAQNTADPAPDAEAPVGPTATPQAPADSSNVQDAPGGAATPTADPPPVAATDATVTSTSTPADPGPADPGPAPLAAQASPGDQGAVVAATGDTSTPTIPVSTTPDQQVNLTGVTGQPDTPKLEGVAKPNTTPPVKVEAANPADADLQGSKVELQASSTTGATAQSASNDAAQTLQGTRTPQTQTQTTDDINTTGETPRPAAATLSPSNDGSGPSVAAALESGSTVNGVVDDEAEAVHQLSHKSGKYLKKGTPDQQSKAGAKNPTFGTVNKVAKPVKKATSTLDKAATINTFAQNRDGRSDVEAATRTGFDYYGGKIGAGLGGLACAPEEFFSGGLATGVCVGGVVGGDQGGSALGRFVYDRAVQPTTRKLNRTNSFCGELGGALCRFVGPLPPTHLIFRAR